MLVERGGKPVKSLLGREPRLLVSALAELRVTAAPRCHSHG